MRHTARDPPHRWHVNKKEISCSCAVQISLKFKKLLQVVFVDKRFTEDELVYQGA